MKNNFLSPQKKKKKSFTLKTVNFALGKFKVWIEIPKFKLQHDLEGNFLSIYIRVIEILLFLVEDVSSEQRNKISGKTLQKLSPNDSSKLFLLQKHPG